AAAGGAADAARTASDGAAARAGGRPVARRDAARARGRAAQGTASGVDAGPLRQAQSQPGDPFAIHQDQGDLIMGKYLVGWLLGVPVFVLVILYFFFH